MPHLLPSAFLFLGEKDIKQWPTSSVKWGNPGHFFRAHGNFFLSFLCAFFSYFWHLKIKNQAFEKFPGSLHFILMSLLKFYYYYYYYYLYYIKMGSNTINNDINVIKEVRELFNEVRSNFLVKKQRELGKDSIKKKLLIIF